MVRSPKEAAGKGKSSKPKKAQPTSQSQAAAPAPQVEQDAAGEAVVAEAQSTSPAPNKLAPTQTRIEDNVLHVRLSHELAAKVRMQAGDEGISVNEYVAELLAEGVVLRAWEIVERKNHMQRHAGNQQQGNHQNQNRHNNNSNNNNNFHRRGGGGGFNNNRRGGMSQQRYQNIMDDKASFLEYVRNQERQGR